MTFKATPEELEEVKYEMWLMADGPKKATDKHEELARASQRDDVEAAGWQVLTTEIKRKPFHDVATIEAVIRRGRELAIIEWHTFNKGWMIQSATGGSFIFRPEERLNA